MFVHRGIAYGQLGQFDEAIADFDRAIALAPDDPWVWSNRAIACGLMGQFDAAIDSLEKLLRSIRKIRRLLRVGGRPCARWGILKRHWRSQSGFGVGRGLFWRADQSRACVDAVGAVRCGCGRF